ncbi:MAG: hypothetical protein JST80_06055 [Bdellovibrionales bacterium]|nr:hypothetical protein [Bdellovibrionales bacterium]
MALRRREKPLSPEELKDKIIKEFGDSWMHSEPHFGFSPDGSLFPLSNLFQSEISLLFLLDAGDYITDRAYEFMQQLKGRYPRLPWMPIIAFNYKYSFLKNTKFFDRFKHFPIFHTTPLFIDKNSHLDRLHKIDGLPTVVFFNRAHDINRISLGGDFQQAIMECERTLQIALRMYDMGLPLPNVPTFEAQGPVDSNRTTLKDVVKGGSWIGFEDTIVTDDPKATIDTYFDGKQLRLISTLHPQARDTSRLQVTMNDKPVPHNLCGSNLKIDDKGNTVVEINRNSGVYELISSPNAIKGKIKIHFVSVIENPVVFYELRTAA